MNMGGILLLLSKWRGGSNLTICIENARGGEEFIYRHRTEHHRRLYITNETGQADQDTGDDRFSSMVSYLLPKWRLLSVAVTVVLVVKMI
jgi:hypothetical protein